MNKLSTELLLLIFRLKKVKEKKYTTQPCDKRDAYIFSNKEEFYNYYIENGIDIQNMQLIDLTIFTELKNGEIIALKGLCDYLITEYKKIYGENNSANLSYVYTKKR